ncbi:non-ribosomal peptide synthetase [Parachitinimonas caeni]|uniref:Amino acid adenylation domain-containing protein n=1 Tax=Parachitinimonas caeni TaxID=3031301 RepID=A0ABT7DZ00_9NEIS|nr:non-ribosomal peptide synthetase [Parachitinimonas caeni]MDK2125234.1 amino acid adenylation domain-containing protein [Parachitinimonas caeni]
MIERSNVKNLYALSPLQEGMLYHALREPTSRAYFEQLDYGLEGPLQVEAWQTAWQRLVDRHDILRTVFAVRKVPQPVQIVLKSAPLVFHYQDLSAQEAEAQAAVIARYKAEDIARGFDLTAEVPLRLALFRQGPASHRVVWSFHHILLDGWSLAMLERDLDALYLAGLREETLRLPPPPPFVAYIKWLAGRDRAESQAFWQTTLAGLEQPTPMPRRIEARFATPAGEYQAAEWRHGLAPATVEGLSELAQAAGTTLNGVVQTLWGLLLGRLNGRRDAVFAATVSGRPADLPNAETTVGIFINAVPVRVRFDDQPTLIQLLQRVHAGNLVAQPHHHQPLAEVMNAHPLRQALLDHILVFENYPLGANAEADPALPRVRNDDVQLFEYTHYPFECQFLPGEETVLRFRFDARCYDPAVMATIAAQFEALARVAAAQPQLGVDALWPAEQRLQAPASVALAASFTAEPAVEAARRWLREWACPSTLVLAPYNQCLQALHHADSPLNQARLGILAFRFADALRDLPDSPEGQRQLDELGQTLLQAIRHRPSQQPLVILDLPAAALSSTLAEAAAQWQQRLQAECRQLPGVSVWPAGEGMRRAVDGALFDPVADHVGHLPYSPAAFAALGAEIARQILCRARPPFKVLAIDCDNTLWGGVCGEAGPQGIVLTAGHLALQAFLLARRAEGWLLTLASKNVAEDVWAVFEQRSDMLLKREHLSAAAINWQPKSENLRALASELNVGVDSVILLDDSLVECTEVMQNCPEALALPLPADAGQFAAWLGSIWAFDVANITAEDRERADMMRAERERDALRQGLPSVDDGSFARQIGLVLRIGPAQPFQFARLAQLTQRTNQFNLSGTRRTEEEIRELAACEDWQVLAVEVEDRFGRYGLTGAVLVQVDNSQQRLLLDTLLLSCRVLGRRVEWAILCALGRLARQTGCRRIAAPLLRTDRNQPLRDFLSHAPWQTDDQNLFYCEVGMLAAEIDAVSLLDQYQFVEDPGSGAQHASTLAGLSARLETPGATPTQRPAFPLVLSNESRLRHRLHYLPLLAYCQGWTATSPHFGPAITQAATLAETPTEQALAALYAEVLGQGAVDVVRRFSEQGGHSLHAVRVVSRIESSLGRQVSLVDFFQHESVRELASWLDGQTSSPTSPREAITVSADAQDFPCSPQQERMWMLSRLGGSTAYQLAAAFRLAGRLNLAALAEACRQVVSQNDILRTVYHDTPDGIRQRLTPNCEVLEVMHWLGKPLQAVVEDMVHQSHKPIELDSDPVIRFVLYRLSPTDAVLGIVLHHIAGDGWSFGLLLEQLAHAYNGGSCADSVGLRYHDYAVWSRSPAAEAEWASQLDWWQQRLGDLPPIARIPADHIRPLQPSGQGHSLSRTMLTQVSRLQNQLTQQRSSLFSFLAASLAALLFRHDRENQVRIGTPVAGRDRPELESVIGLFVNTVVLDFAIDQEDSFATLLEEATQRSQAALDHASLPFDRLVHALAPPRQPGRHALFDVLLVLQNSPRSTSGLEGIQVCDVTLPTRTADLDLVFEFGIDADDRLRCTLRYSTDLYLAASAERLLGRLQMLLEQAIATPDCLINQLPMLTIEEARQLDQFGRGRTMPVPQWSLADRIAMLAGQRPAAQALICRSGTVDYQTLDRRAHQLAMQLLQRPGGQPGLPVAVLMDRDSPWASALLACFKAACVYLPLDARHPDARLLDLLADADCQLLLTSPQLGERMRRAGLPASVEILIWDDSDDDGAPLPALPDFSAHLADEAPAYLLYTSGSTGKPKGVRVSHRAFANMIADQIASFSVQPGDVVLQLAAAAFDASLSEFFMAWLAGATVALVDTPTTRDSQRLGRFLRECGVTVATFTPSHLRQIEPADLNTLRCLILAGEAAFGHDLSRIARPGLSVFNAYGPTETAVCATLGMASRAVDEAGHLAIGRPVANSRVRIVNPAGEPQPLGVPGELWVEGVGVALGYLNRPQESAARFYLSNDGLRGYRTGDLACWLADGQICYLGRQDDQVKIRGQRCEPGELEAALLTQQGISAAAVLVQQGPTGAELVACLQGQRISDEVLRARLAQILPLHLLPGHVRWLDQLPLTVNGKVDRSALAKLPLPAPTPIETEALDLSPLAEQVLQVFQQILPGIGPDTDFFTGGGNSLAAMQLARRIEQHLSLPCPAGLIFQLPTARQLADGLHRPAPLVAGQLRHYGSAPISPENITLIALPPAPGLGVVYAGLAAHLPDCDLYSLDADFDQSIETWLEALCEQACQLPQGEKLVLLGYSGGGKLALGLAGLLHGHGRVVDAVILLDCWQNTGQALTELTATPLGDGLVALAAEADETLEEARERLAEQDARYCRMLDLYSPTLALSSPITHLLAKVDDPIPASMHRNWHPLALRGYRERSIPANHHALLSGSHLRETVAALIWAMEG